MKIRIGDEVEFGSWMKGVLKGKVVHITSWGQVNILVDGVIWSVRRERLTKRF